MGWQDRDYNRQINYGGTPFTSPLLNIIFGSIPLGRWFGIRVRMHASLLWYIAFRLLQGGTLGWFDVLASSVLIFAIVLLHEFGHCIGARMVGGTAEDILLWPLGGLAFTDTARTPWARFVTVICGPLVNVIIAIVLGLVFLFAYHAPPPLNPLYPWMGSAFLPWLKAYPQAWQIFEDPAGKWLFWAFTINWSMLMFNLMPMYPLDGGKLLQVALWKPLGYYKSLYYSCITGMIGAVLMAIFGIFTSSFFLVFLALFGFVDCMNQLQYARMAMAEGDSEQYDLSAAWEHPDGSPTKRKKIKKRWLTSARKRALQDQAEQAKIDSILAKVKEKGLHSLTWWEKRTLRKATERQRQHDLAERR